MRFFVNAHAFNFFVVYSQLIWKLFNNLPSKKPQIIQSNLYLECLMSGTSFVCHSVSAGYCV